MLDYPGHAKYHFCVQRPRLRYKRLLGDLGRPVALLWRLLPWSGIRSELASGEFLIAGRCAVNIRLTLDIMDWKRRHAVGSYYQDRRRANGAMAESAGSHYRPDSTDRHGMDDG